MSTRTSARRDEPPAEDAAALDPPGDPESVARTICLRLLDGRARTRRELADALRRRGVPDDAADRVLDRFGEVGLIDDQALADGYALAVHRERGLAGRAVAASLRRRGVADDVVRTAVAQIEPDSERDRAEQLVRARLRTMSGLEPAARVRRLVGLLGRKGYPADLAYRVVRDVIGELDLISAGGDQEPLD